MEKVTTPNEFLFTADELVKLFNIKLQEHLNHFTEIKKRAIESGEHIDMIEGHISIWLDVDLCLTPQSAEEELKNRICESGWYINEYKWVEDDRTGVPKILIRIEPQCK